MPAQPGAWLAWALGLPYLWARVQLSSEGVGVGLQIKGLHWMGPLLTSRVLLSAPVLQKDELLPVTGERQS